MDGRNPGPGGFPDDSHGEMPTTTVVSVESFHFAKGETDFVQSMRAFMLRWTARLQDFE